MGKSALRKSQFLMEDPKYGGKRSNRKAIFNEDDDQEISEDEGDLDEEIDDDEEIDSEAGDADGQQSSDDDDQVDGEEESEEGGFEQFDSEDDEDDLAHPIENDAEVQEELKRLREEEKKMLSTMSKSAKSDVEKGQHVKQQLNLWDGFLDTRIRMQKAMNITNQLPQVRTKKFMLACTDMFFWHHTNTTTLCKCSMMCGRITSWMTPMLFHISKPQNQNYEH